MVPVLIYSLVGWYAPKTNARVLEGNQRRCSKGILCDYDLPYTDSAQQLNILPLSLNLQLCDLLMLFHILSSKYSYDWSNHLETFSPSSSARSRRSSESQLFLLPSIFKEQCRDNFRYRTPRLAIFLPTWINFC